MRQLPTPQGLGNGRAALPRCTRVALYSHCFPLNAGYHQNLHTLMSIISFIAPERVIVLLLLRRLMTLFCGLR